MMSSVHAVFSSPVRFWIGLCLVLACSAGAEPAAFDDEFERLSGALEALSTSSVEQRPKEAAQLEDRLLFVRREAQRVGATAAARRADDLRRRLGAARRVELPKIAKVLAAPAAPAEAKGLSGSDACESAPLVDLGLYSGSTMAATPDGAAFCGLPTSGDVWYRFRAAEARDYFFDLESSDFESLISLHEFSCPGTGDNDIGCAVDAFGEAPAIRWRSPSVDEEILVRVSGADSQDLGSFGLRIATGGSLAGQVRSADGGQPISDVRVLLYPEDGFNAIDDVVTGADGRYQFDSLQAGRYLVHAWPTDDRLGQIFGGVDCWSRSPFDCPIEEATAVEVSLTSEVGGIDLELTRGGALTGTVRDQNSGEPLPGVEIDIFFDDAFTRFDRIVTDSNGVYRAMPLPSGTFLAETRSPLGYASEVWDDQVCPTSGCQPSLGTPISVTRGQTTDGIDFDLIRLGGISGKVTNAQTGEPVPFVEVQARAVLAFSGTVRTDLDGNYRVANLQARSYTVETNTFGRYVDVIYDDQLCSFGSCSLDNATPIEVTLGETVTGVDLAVEPGAMISGRVTAAADGAPQQEIEVEVRDDRGIPRRSAYPDPDGRYSIGALNAGDYFVTAKPVLDGIAELTAGLYDDMVCPVDYTSTLICRPLDGTPVTVALNEERSDIDFALRRRGSISGRVTGLDGEPLANVLVKLEGADLFFSVEERTTDDGTYRFENLPLTDYFAFTRNEEFVDQLWEGSPCEPGCSAAQDGTPLSVAADAQITGIACVVARGGRVTGRVQGGRTGEGIRATIRLIDVASGQGKAGISSHTGNFEIAAVPPGTYVAVAGENGFRAEVWDDIPCPIDSSFDGTGSCDLALGQPIAIEEGSAVESIDFTLDAQPEIVGRMFDAATGEEIDGRIRLWNGTGTEEIGFGVTQFGDYRFRLRDAGSYRLSSSSQSVNGYIDILHGGQFCPMMGCDATRGGAVFVDFNQVLEIDFPLTVGAGLAGQVTDASGLEGLPDFIVQDMLLWDSRGVLVNRAGLGNRGYRFRGLPTGDYFLTSSAARGFVDELYDDFPCPDGDCEPLDGTPIRLVQGQLRDNVDMALDRWGDIESTVRDAFTGAPIAGAEIFVRDREGRPYVRSTTPADGRVLIGPLPPAEAPWHLWVEADGYEPQLFSDLPCPDDTGCDGDSALQGTPLDPPLNGRLTADFSLLPSGPQTACTPDSSALCLLGGRFRVEVEWQRPNGNTGRGQAVALSGESGYFWFFGASNVELVVKSLDACGSQFDSFWFFAAGLTNVETRISVTDTVSGAEKVYFNPLGRAFQPVLDTGAFETCNVAAPRSSTPRTPAPEVSGAGLLQLLAEAQQAARRTIAQPPAAEKAGDCTASSTVLCLNDDRFAVEATWTRANGNSGPAENVRLTANTGTLTFFDPDNVEVIVKVLDACGGSNPRFWVFAAGLTNVDVELRVTDTKTGEIRTYRNLLGEAFPPIQDTMAFSSCP